jgi:two-component system CheB/CheR fusion protein
MLAPDASSTRRADLRASEEWFGLLCEAIKGIVYDWDVTTGWVDRSDGTADLVGYHAREVEPSMAWWHERIHPDDRERFQHSCSTAMSRELPLFVLAYRVIRRDGSIAYVQDRARIVYDGAGQAVRVVGSIQESSAREAIAELNIQLEARLREMQTILDTAPVGINIAEDPECKVIRSNLALAEMLGMAPGENISKSSPDADRLPYRVFRDGKEVPPDDLPMQRAARLRISIKDELLEIVRGDGSQIKVLMRAEPIKGAQGAVKGAVGICVDVTDPQRAEQALKEADRRKDQFLAILAHELRNPLSSITNALALLRMPDLDEQSRGWAGEMAERQLWTLVRLVDDLLDVSRISSGKLQLRKEMLDAATVVSRVVDTLRTQLSERKHELSVEIDPGPLPLWGDATRLEQILNNLLHNAAKYTDDGGRIILKARREGDEIVLEVADNGIGIPSEVLPRLFELYSQADTSLNRSHGGLGIGLTLVRKLALMHGGSVMVASDGPGKGSVFSVRLPVASAAIKATLESQPADLPPSDLASA